MGSDLALTVAVLRRVVAAHFVEKCFSPPDGLVPEEDEQFPSFYHHLYVPLQVEDYRRSPQKAAQARVVLVLELPLGARPQAALSLPRGR